MAIDLNEILNKTNLEAMKPALEAVLRERHYQELAWPEVQSVEAEVLLLKRYADKALMAWADTRGDEAALDAIRNIAAIAVRAMEHHGVVARKRRPC